ncbi:MAG: acyl-CoA dehydrogenase family protein [SAR324 cluster bacterium]|nr:acyl-CoA dehydrogenase family protein [SAR324 cluster bacterium]
MNQTVPEDDFAEFLGNLRRFVRERLIPNEHRLEEDDAVPEEILEEMRRLGLFATSLPVEYGGLGLTMEQQVRAHMEFTQASAVYRSRLSTTIGLGAQPLLHHGSEEQRREYLPRMASGEITASFGLTEPEAGSDAGSLRTAAVREGGEYVLNGIKRYITNAPEADLFIVMARTNPEIKGAAGISAFIVPAGTPGLSVGPIDKKMGQAGAHTAEVFFNDCRVPASALIGGKEGEGFKTAMAGINHARLHVACTCVGQALRLTEEALDYATKRVQFDKPIVEFQAIQGMLADCRTEAFAARAMILDTARRQDQGEDVITDISCCKYYASEMVCRVADRAVQIHGGAGYMAASTVERLYRDVRLFRIFEGTSQIQQIIIARGMLKERQPE